MSRMVLVGAYAEAVSPLALPATGIEAYKPWERKRLLRRRYTMRIYERISSTATADLSGQPYPIDDINQASLETH